jgi:hypothetical protein
MKIYNCKQQPVFAIKVDKSGIKSILIGPAAGPPGFLLTPGPISGPLRPIGELSST